MAAPTLVPVPAVRGGGTVFEVDNAGHYTALYSFCAESNCTDGAWPFSGLIQDATGNLYGTTLRGGANTVANGGGTAFKLAPPAQQGGAWTEIVLYSFCSASNCTDGEYPEAALLQDAAGNLYGTTAWGGANGGGTLFKLAPPAQQGGAWTETVLYSFCSVANCADGEYPYAGLIQDAAGNLYGTTECGGANANTGGGLGCIGAGTVFKLAAGSAGVTLTSSTNPSYVNQSVLFSAAVSGVGTATPTGTVTFEEGKTTLGTVTLANGQASLTKTLTKGGSFSITANYSGDQNYGAATSSPLTQVVNNQYTTTTTIASSFNPSTYGEAITLIATVSSSGGPIPTGTVTFKNGSKSIGSATLSDGGAQITTSKLPAGTLAITASYSGDAANAKSTSPTLQQVVKQATSTTAIASSVNPSKVGQTVKFVATVTSPTTKPTGTVTFMDGSTVLGTGTIVAGTGKASFSTSTLSEGSHNITAVYAGNANVIGSTSPILVQVVN
ncbi:MAG: Ig-like domain repeat protein [Candidatus Sulfotelmatobacter sp.]